MKPAARLSLAVAVAVLAPGIGWSAVPDAIRSEYADRVEHGERVFGDVRFVMGSGQSMEWLEMYVGTNLVGAYRDFDAQEVSASPDGRYFLAMSTTSLSSLAFAVIDRTGHVLYSRPQNAGEMHYCGTPSTRNRNWIDPAAAHVRFEVDRTAGATPAREYLKSVTVKVCDGKDMLLWQAADPSVQVPAARPVALDSSNEYSDSSMSFIANTIANLRSLDPTFGARTLTGNAGNDAGKPSVVNVPGP